MAFIRLSSAGGLSVYLVVIVAACLVPALCLPTTKQQEKSVPDQQKRPVAPKLFSFHNYQQLFKKNYGSTLERVTRRVYFLARAFAAYASGVAFRLWKKTYYLAVNEFSDWSPKELAMTWNKFEAGERARKATFEHRPLERESMFAPRNAMNGSVKAVKELEGKILDVLEKPQFKILGEERSPNMIPRRRRKRNVPISAGSTSKRPLRPLSMDKLIKGSEHKSRPAWVRQAKVNKNPKSNNGKYDKLALEGISRGLIDQQKDIRVWFLTPPVESRVKANFEANAKAPIIDEYDSEMDLIMDEAPPESADNNQLPDEMFADLRQTGCWFPPRQQGQCGSCYAFAGISIVEFLFCRKTNQLVAFSEQYMLDCGTGRIDGANGCISGRVDSVTKFVHNFGLELQEHLKYSGREGECPYDKDTNLETTGFFRMDLGAITVIPVEFWPEALKHGPLHVEMRVSDDFQQYAGGVHDGRGCKEENGHSVVLVGHGREQGQEYWLMRNSYGTEWGEYGHFKLAKSASLNCIRNQLGFSLGSMDGSNFVDPRINDLNANARQWMLHQQQQQQMQRQYSL